MIQSAKRAGIPETAVPYVVALVFGLTLLNTWSDVIGHAPAFGSAAALLDGPLANGRMLFSSGLCVSSLLAAAFPEVAWRHRGAFSLAAAALGALASVLYLLSPSLGTAAAAAAATGAFMVGALYGWFEVRLLSLSTYRPALGMEGTLWCLAASLVLKTLVSGAVGAAPQALQVATLVLCPLAVTLFAIIPLARRSGSLERESTGIRSRRDARTWLCFLLLGAILSAVARAVSNLGYWGTSNLVGTSTVVCTLLAAPLFLAIAWLTLIRAKGGVSGLALGLLVLLTGFLAIELIGENGTGTEMRAILTTSVELYGHMLFWGLIVLSMGHMGMHPYRVVGAAEGAMSAAAVALAMLLVGVAGSERTLVAVSLYAAAAVALFLFKRVNTEAEGLEERLASVPQARPAPLGPAALPGYALLTQRERDVCTLLAQGRDRSYIADALGLSEGTVKTHVQHVYQKLSVHSKQELISRVAEVQNSVVPVPDEGERGRRDLPTGR